MQATDTWSEPGQPVHRSKRELWFALIRTVIVVALVGAAAGFLAIAYAPQWFAPRSALGELYCPPLVVTVRETDVSMGINAQTDLTETGAVLLVDKSARRPPAAIREEHRNGAKKRPAVQARSVPLPERAGRNELAKSQGRSAKQTNPKPSSPAPTLAQSTTQSTVYPSPFGDMHGQ